MYLNDLVTDGESKMYDNWTLTWDVFKYDEDMSKAQKALDWTLTWDVFK